MNNHNVNPDKSGVNDDPLLSVHDDLNDRI